MHTHNFFPKNCPFGFPKNLKQNGLLAFHWYQFRDFGRKNNLYQRAEYNYLYNWYSKLFTDPVPWVRGRAHVPRPGFCRLRGTCTPSASNFWWSLRNGSARSNRSPTPPKKIFKNILYLKPDWKYLGNLAVFARLRKFKKIIKCHQLRLNYVNLTPWFPLI